LWSCASLARFSISVGLEAVPEVLFRSSVIERFVIVGMAAASPSRRRDIRTNLRFVARQVVPELCQPLPVALPRSRAKIPYSPGEIDAYLALADAQPSLARRMRLQALVCLGAGAGLTGADLRDLRGDDVMFLSGGLIVAVRGRSPRTVPLLSPYHERLRDSAAFAGGGFVVGGVSGDRHNVTNRLVASISGGHDLGHLELSRLRATWLATVAERLGLPGLFKAAGFSFSQQLCDLVANMAVPDNDDLVDLLG
jgi:integrase